MERKKYKGYSLTYWYIEHLGNDADIAVCCIVVLLYCCIVVLLYCWMLKSLKG